MSDLGALQILDFILQDRDDIPTAVIFTHAEDLSRANFQGTSFRELQNRMVRWARAPSDTPHRCVLVFQSSTLEGLRETCRRNELTVVSNFLDSRGEEGLNVVRIGGPDAREILNAVHRFRLKSQMAVDWTRLERMAQWLAAENLPLYHWKGRLREARELTPRVVESWLPNRPYSDRSAEDRLNELVGLGAVKEQIRRKLAKAEVLGEGRAGTLHMAFLGNPGTGKTTVAELVGEIFRDHGLLERGHTVTAQNTGDLEGEYVGQTAPKVNALVDQALDGVLFIDEAHNLIREDGGRSFGTEAVRTLVARMERERGRLCVVLAGYPEPVRRLVASDPGLGSRVKDEICFEDYSPDELARIFALMAEAAEMSVAPEAAKDVEAVLKGMYETRDPGDWANAREVRNLFEEMLESFALRHLGKPPTEVERTLLPGDVPEKYRDFVEVRVDVDEILRELDELTGLGPVKDFVRNLAYTARHDQKRRDEGLPVPERPLMHMLFTGNPGTGKTTVAKLMGRVLKGLGMLPKGHVVRATGGELAGSHVGEGIEKAREKVREALGGILFIDEIYGLTQGSLGNSYGSDVIHNVLVPAMTEHRSNLVVVGAGYTGPVEEFLRANEGLRSRFPNVIPFPDFRASELATILKRYAARQGYRLSPQAETTVEAALEKLVGGGKKDFGNARDVERYFDEMRRSLAVRTARMEAPAKEDLSTLTEEDLPSELKDWVRDASFEF